MTQSIIVILIFPMVALVWISRLAGFVTETAVV
jgi:hypothetical protein